MSNPLCNPETLTIDQALLRERFVVFSQGVRVTMPSLRPKSAHWQVASCDRVLGQRK
jgi:hypothetical protein